MRFKLFHQIQNRPLDPKFHFHFYHFPLTEDCPLFPFTFCTVPYALNSLLDEKCTPKYSLKKLQLTPLCSLPFHRVLLL